MHRCIIQDLKSKTTGMVHVVLPLSKTNPDKASAMPGYFADTGIAILLKKMVVMGCSQDRKGKLVKLVGGAQIMDPNNTFNIGKRNLLATKKILWRYRLGAIAEDVGGTISRSVSVETGTGKTIISSPGRGNWEI
jgi:chemotaxis protein CheD